jgi:hypothetical protein
MEPVNNSPRASSTSEAADGDAAEPGGSAGGWLLVLCVVLLVWQPFNVGLAASRLLDSLAIRGLPLALVLFTRVLVAGLGIGAGLALLGRRPSGVALARLSLVASAAMDLFVYLTPYVPNNRAPGETPLIVLALMTHYTLWLMYLARSKRVRATFAHSPRSRRGQS